MLIFSEKEERYTELSGTLKIWSHLKIFREINIHRTKELEIFRQINLLNDLLGKTLITRNFCEKFVNA